MAGGFFSKESVIQYENANMPTDKINLKKTTENYRPVAIWLYVGVFMIVVQILLGGITRLTESGLSITEWKPITGVLPPLNDAQWQAEFDKYKTTSQFQYIHENFRLSDFKQIFFWEWFHRVWARLMGFVFIVGFVWFAARRKFSKAMIMPLIMLFLLGAIQGAIGWIMVKSGLVPERLFVGHIELATHFMAALLLLVYTFWFALSLSVGNQSLVVNKPLKNWGVLIMVVLFFQLIYGAFMAGTHAAIVAPTWPDINGKWAPDEMTSMRPLWENWIQNKLAIQFIHRGLAYILFILTFIWWQKSIRAKGSGLFHIARVLPVALVTIQVLLGIFTVVTSPYGNNLVYFGVAHQTVGILYLLSVVLVLYTVRKRQPDYSLTGN